MPGVCVEDLEQYSVRELRRQAAVRNVPLQHIAAAVEKKDLISMILNARPITDQYAVGSITKVHSAESIAHDSKQPQPPKKKKKKSRSGSSDSSSSSGKKRKKKRKGRSRSRKRRRSPDAAMKTLPQIREAAKALLIAQAPAHTVPAGSAMIAGAGRSQKGGLAAGSAAPIFIEDERPTPSVAEAGMAAAAALGFNVKPKATKQAALTAPAPGLRPSLTNPSMPALPSINISTAPLAQLAGRICVEYLCKASCALGANCPELHITDPEEEMKIRARFKEQECHYGANCTRSSCLYRHPGEKLDNFAGLSLVPEGQQVTMRPSGGRMALDFK
mmetsp:Transcript_13009/g.29536  ORF Transcript_13009/g.29536 Transcript_13009/m.29536 type:complete len:331 (-) Transcript_13009:58-1050(-)